MYKIDTSQEKPDIDYMYDVLVNTARLGIVVSEASRYVSKFKDIADFIEKEIQVKYGIDNPRSTGQISAFMNREAAKLQSDGYRNEIVEIAYDTKTGKFSTQGKVLRKLSQRGYEFADDILAYRRAKKYYDSANELMETSDENMLVHPEVALSKTHRISYRKPALMNIPKVLLWNFISPRKSGNILYSVDIKNQEPSILVGMLDEPSLNEALKSEEGLYNTVFRNIYKPYTRMNVLKDELDESKIYAIEELEQKRYCMISPDLYNPIKAPCHSWFYQNERVVAVQQFCCGYDGKNNVDLPKKVVIMTDTGALYNIDVRWTRKEFDKSIGNNVIYGEMPDIRIEIMSQDRVEFKTSFLSFTYGASEKSIEEDCFNINGAMAYKYLSSLKSIKEYKSMIDKHVKKGNDSIKTLFGTRVYSNIPLYQKAQLKRSLSNLPIQGTAADILSLLLKRFFSESERLGFNSKMEIYYTRHDEVILEVDRNWINDVGTDHVEAVIKDIFEHQLIIDGRECEPFKLEIHSVQKNEDIESVLKESSDEDIIED